MMKNVLKFVVFAFKMVKGADYLAVMTRQRLSDGENELPYEDIGDTNCDYSEYISKCLSQQLSLSGTQYVFPIGTYHSSSSEDTIVVSAYGVFLEQFPGNAYGINWRVLSPDIAIFEQLNENDERTLADAKKAFSMRLLCGEFDKIAPEKQKKLMDVLVSKDEIKKISSSLSIYGRLSGVASFSDDELKAELLLRKGKDENGKLKQKYYIYNYFRAGQAVDIVVLGTKIYKDANNRVSKVELQVPLIKRKADKHGKGVGIGWWGLPGGFIQEKHYRAAGWEPKEENGIIEDTDFDPSKFTEYRDSLKGGGRVVTSAAREILRTKTGIDLSEQSAFYSLSLRDNPHRGTVDGSPVVAYTLLSVFGEYEKEPVLSWSKDSNVESAEWFTISRVLFNDKGEIIKKEHEPLATEGNASELSLGKKTAPDLRSNADATDAFFYGRQLIINYFQGDIPKDETTRSETRMKAREKAVVGKALPIDDPKEMDLFADHKDAIIDALQLIKEKTHTSTILIDFLRPKEKVSLRHLKLTYEDLVFPEVTVREYLAAKIVAKDDNSTTGFLVKNDDTEEYVINMEKFNEFLYSRVSIL